MYIHAFSKEYKFHIELTSVWSTLKIWNGCVRCKFMFFLKTRSLQFWIPSLPCTSKYDRQERYILHHKFSNCGAGSLGRAQVVWMKDIFILNEIWAQDIIYVSVGTSFSWNMKFTLLCKVNFTKVYARYSIAQLYVRFICLNLFGWMGREVHEKF
jgi:hypothetical protein